MQQIVELRDIIIRAWDETQPCSDGIEAKFCPSCLYETIRELVNE